ncbi:YkvA family protein [Polaromonas sp.]|uniref:YkvA family protein n=1 Tax=Polaromonas sp. TaxID=1869339 RepID=UPI00375007B8
MVLAQRLKRWAQSIKRDGVTLWFATRHSGVPWYAKALGIFVVAYALSPIDLIPDFIPVLGYLDDVILLPGLIWLAIRMIPAPVLGDCRDLADQWMKTKGGKPTSRVGAVVIVLIWIGVTFALWHGVLQPWLGA